jgi:hypothetical protein
MRNQFVNPGLQICWNGETHFNFLTQRRKGAETQSKSFWTAAGSEAPRRFGSSVRNQKAVSPLRSATAVQNPCSARGF